MTMQQIVRELRSVPASGVEEWMDLRAEQVAALNDEDRRAIIRAVDGLKRWRRSLVLVEG